MVGVGVVVVVVVVAVVVVIAAITVAVEVAIVEAVAVAAAAVVVVAMPPTIYLVCIWVSGFSSPISSYMYSHWCPQFICLDVYPGLGVIKPDFVTTCLGLGVPESISKSGFEEQSW